ncbi:uncharacterized protein At4g22758 [Salvia miltiorrhiza]|uniref:uncharacterized protein At4g22758 n=1 Tax=Salvia miltiorrhiza TaxID=226208 RepID=UPI0025AB88E8|nr:uncharacterized protein At4g22758 [Salvia miltiorrhiza]
MADDHRDFRRRKFPANRRTARRSPAEARRRINPEAGRSLSPSPSEYANFLKRYKSEPFLPNSAGREVAVIVDEEAEEEMLYRPHTCTDIFLPPSGSLQVYKYNRDAKVVVNVTVEGSPGAVRTMVKLGADVAETIKLVIKKYNQEGRTPPLHEAAAANCELHHSFFSLHRLKKSDLIGDIGSRSFYLRKQSINNHEDEAAQISFLPKFINNLIRATQKLCKIFGCIS